MYELVNGRKRIRWNNLTSTASAVIINKHEFEIVAIKISDGSPSNMIYVPAWNPFMSAPPFSDNEDLKLGSKLLKAVKQHEFNLGVNLGQMHQTVGLLSSTLSKLGLSILALKRGDFATAARCLGASPRPTRLKPRDISGRWLELMYGWIPLLSDSFEAAKAFEAISSGPRTKMFRVNVKRAAYVETSSSPLHYTCRGVSLRRRFLQYEMYEEMGFARQLGLADPLSVLWELTPYSFVVDWFIPVGTYLSNLNQIPNLKGRFLISDVETIKCSNAFKWVFVGDFGNGLYLSSTMKRYPTATSRWTTYSRYINLSPSQLYARPKFDFGAAFSIGRLKNAIALCHQRFSSKNYV